MWHLMYAIELAYEEPSLLKDTQCFKGHETVPPEEDQNSATDSMHKKLVQIGHMVLEISVWTDRLMIQYTASTRAEQPLHMYVCKWQMSSQMLQLQSRQDQEHDKMQQFANTVDSGSAEQTSSSEQLLDVVR